jgi:hypothetical protein
MVCLTELLTADQLIHRLTKQRFAGALSAINVTVDPAEYEAVNLSAI